MQSILRISLSVFGSVALSVLASWALRRLLLGSTAGGDENNEKRWGPIVVVMPIITGNQWLLGQPVRPDTAVASGEALKELSSHKEK
jgi:hypothetical protein